MCLSSNGMKRFGPNDDIHVGYKVFCKTKTGKYYPEIKSQHRRYSLGNEYNAPKRGKIRESYIEYDTGFHVFKNIADARCWRDEPDVICEVHAWDIRAVGYQGFAGRDMPAFVTKNMRIIREIK